MIPTDKLASTHEAGFGNKLRAGGKVSEHEFREGMAKIMGVLQQPSRTSRTRRRQ
jgi:hypothetical protein